MIVGLALAQPPGPFRGRLLRILVETGEDLVRREDTKRTVEPALLNLRVAQRLPRRQRMMTRDVARTTVAAFMNTARSYHARSPWGAWWTLHQLLTEEAFTDDKRHGMLRNLDWDLVFRFLQDELVPVFGALAHLRRRPALAPHRVDDLIRNMFLAFEHMQRLAWASEAEQLNLSDLRVSWLELPRRSLSTAVNLIYARDRETVLGAEAGVVDSLLCATIQEPIGLILHNLAAAFDRRLQITLVVQGVLQRSKQSPLQEHLLWLNQVWLENSTLPVVWEHADALRMCYHVFADNVRRRGAPEPEIVVQVRFDGAAFDLSIENRRHFAAQPAGPRGYGLRQAEDATKRLNGDLLVDEAVTTFRVVQRLPVECLNLYREGE